MNGLEVLGDWRWGERYLSVVVHPSSHHRSPSSSHVSPLVLLTCEVNGKRLYVVLLCDVMWYSETSHGLEMRSMHIALAVGGRTA
jgi:hypothetical protein